MKSQETSCHDNYHHASLTTVSSEVTYLVLADQLAEELALLRAGERFASEHELVDRYGVSRITARAALGELEQRHLVRRTRGSGTFSALRLPYPVQSGMPPSWSDLVRATGHTPSHDYTAVERVRATAEVARGLLIPRGRSVVRVGRVSSVDDQVAATSVHWIPADLVPRVENELPERGSLTATLREAYGIRSERWWARAELQTPPADIAEALELVGRPPSWRIQAVNRSTGHERPIEYATSWMRADCFRVFLDLGPSDGIAPELGP